MTSVVVDASVAVKWFTREADSDAAQSVFRTGLSLLAPRLIVTEVASALARKVAAKIVDPADAQNDITSLPMFLTTLLDVDELIVPAFQNACAIGHPIYDLIYLEAARRSQTLVVTADRRFVGKVADTPLRKYVVLLSEWSA